MSNNLVPGGARPGLFQTRLNRVVKIHTPILRDLPLEPGQEKPITQTLWQGTFYMSDGHTPETEDYWEASGAYRSMNGVSSVKDLAMLIKADPIPEPAPEPIAAIPAKEETKEENSAPAKEAASAKPAEAGSKK